MNDGAAWERLREHPRIMGIVNINDDSFSGDGSLDIGNAKEKAVRLAREGADFIDVGAESARTNRAPVSPGEEIDRLLPFLDGYRALFAKESPQHERQFWPPLLSVNTWRPEVIRAVLATGEVDLVNDMSGLEREENARLCVEVCAALLIMHTKAPPKVARTGERYDDVWADLERFFDERLARANAAGLPKDRIVLDPGIDFAKQREDNLSIYRELERLVGKGVPVLLPVSRKTVIGEVLGLDNPSDRDAGTIACMVRGVMAGAAIFRVHEVRAAAHAMGILEAVRAAA